MCVPSQVSLQGHVTELPGPGQGAHASSSGSSDGSQNPGRKRGGSRLGLAGRLQTSLRALQHPWATVFLPVLDMVGDSHPSSFNFSNIKNK